MASSVVRATWLALLQPKRLIPVLLVSTPLVLAQAHYSPEPIALPVAIAVAMCAVFIGLAPVSYRVLFPDGLELSHGAVRLVLYGAIGAGAVLSVGAAAPKVLGVGPMFLGDRWALAVCTALFLVGGWGLGRDIGFEQRVARLQRAADEAQLLALRAHLDPHFLFNTLNAIAEWCRQDGAVAERAVLKLSQLLRSVLGAVTQSHWPLENELHLVRALFELHQLRDPNAFTVVEQLCEPLPAVEVPPMALLALAENAVKHGPAAGYRGPMTLSVSVAPGVVELRIENPGPYRGPRPDSHGLPTLRRRLALLYDQRATLDVGPSPTDASRTRAALKVMS